MLEGIFHQRDKHQGPDLYIGDLQVLRKRHLHIRRQTDLHQVHITVEELDLILQGHLVELIVVQHVAQHLGELLDGILGPLGVEGRQRIDIVKRVQQEVRIDLRTQVPQFRLAASRLRLQTRILIALPTGGQHDSRRHSRRHRQTHDITKRKENLVDRTLLIAWQIGTEQVIGEVHPRVEDDTEGKDHDRVVKQIVTPLSDDEALRCQPQIVDIKHHHHQERRHARHQIVERRHTIPSQIRQGRKEHKRPDTHMQEQIYLLIHV